MLSTGRQGQCKLLQVSRAAGQQGRQLVHQHRTLMGTQHRHHRRDTVLTLGAMDAAILSYSEASARISSSCSCSQGRRGEGRQRQEHVSEELEQQMATLVGPALQVAIL